jgi:hypothetical protein
VLFYKKLQAMQTCTGLLKNEKFRPKAELPILLVGAFPQTPLIEDFIFGSASIRRLISMK